jgi:hypothetical protein
MFDGTIIFYYTSELYNMQVHNLDFSPQTTYAPPLHANQLGG